MKHRPTHILVECPDLIASVRVAVLNALEPLEKASICKVRFCKSWEICKEDLVWCDIFVCVRGSETISAYIVQEAKRLGRFVLYFLDDDLLHIPMDSMSRAYFEYGNHQKALVDCLAASDGLWVVNPRIQDCYLPLCGKNRVIISRVPVQVENMPQQEESSVVRVIYAGSSDHQNLVRELLAPAVRSVLAKCKGRIKFTFIGPDPGLDDCPDVSYYPFFDDYDQYRDFVNTGGFQVGLAPTRLENFYQCKYYNKFIEYTMMGAVGVYTNSPLYTQVVRNEETGILCDNTPDDWAEKIIKISSNSMLQKKCLSNSKKLLEKEFSPEQVADNLLSQIPELRDFRAPEISKNAVNLPPPKLYFYWNRVCFLINKYRFMAIPMIAFKICKKIIKIVFRRTRC